MRTTERRSQRQPRRRVRRALWVSAASILWTVASGATEVVLGLSHHVLTLVVFGGAGALDAAGSAMLVLHFGQALRHDVPRAQRERRASLVISAGLVTLGAVTVVEATRRLVGGRGGGDTAVFAVAGAAVGTHRGRAWVDPVASLMIAGVAAAYGVTVLVRGVRED